MKKSTEGKSKSHGGGWFKKGYWGLAKGEGFLSHILLLIIRLYWGWLLMGVGLGKWMNLAGVAESFAAINIPFPYPMAIFVGGVELLGGLSLFIGLFTRVFSLLLTILFFVAYATAHAAALAALFVNPSLFIAEGAFLFLYAALVVLCFGPGCISVDYWLEKKAYGEAL